MLIALVAATASGSSAEEDRVQPLQARGVLTVRWKICCRRDGVLASLRCTIAQLRCHDASVSRLTAMGMPLLVERLLDHWHP